jgi:hypothetical protein
MDTKTTALPSPPGSLHLTRKSPNCLRSCGSTLATVYRGITCLAPSGATPVASGRVLSMFMCSVCAAR